MKKLWWVFLIFLTSLPASAQTAFYAVWADTGEIVAQQNETLSLNPASSLKILTSYCALKKLGGHATIPTDFLTEGPIQNGEIKNLTVKGYGDPSMVSERLWLAVQHLKGLGIKKINGDILIDDSFFGAPDYPGRQENNQRAYNSPLSAVSLNYNTVTIKIYNHGAQPTLHIFPPIPYFQIDNRVRIGGKQTHVTIGSRFNGSQEILTVSGTIPAKQLEKPATYYRSIQHPALFFGEALKTLLIESGVSVAGVPKKGSAQGKQILFEFESRPLREMIANMNKYSNNFMAEQIVRILGANTSGPPGTTEKGVAILKQCLKEVGGNSSPVQIENGSGLSYENKISAKDLMRPLLAGLRDFSIQPELISSLSVDGRDGTMRSRKSPAELEGFLRAKTGSLNGTSSLAGVVPNREGRLIAFVILMDNYKGGLWKSHQVQDQLVQGWRSKK